MKLLIVIVVLLLVFVQYKLWFSNGILNTQHLQKTVNAKNIENMRASERNKALTAEIEDLKSGYQAVEEHARHDLGMINNDETFYQLTLPNN